MASLRSAPISANGCGGQARTTRATCPGISSCPSDWSTGPSGAQADPQSVPGAVDLDCGIQLRGSIDLVERHPSGQVRVTDHKTGKADGKRGQLIDGGKSLQPLLYALAAEKLFAGEAKVTSGRLYFCTSTGGFAEQVVPLDERGARRGRPGCRSDRRGGRPALSPGRTGQGAM